MKKKQTPKPKVQTYRPQGIINDKELQPNCIYIYTYVSREMIPVFKNVQFKN